MNKQRINLAILFIVTFLGFGFFLPYNSLYLKETLGFNGDQIGLFYGLSSVIVIVSVPLFGILADKIKSARNVYIMACILSLVFFIPYNISRSFFILTTMYVIINAIRSTLIPMLDSMSISHSLKYQNNYGVFRSLSSLAFILASLSMGFLLQQFSNLTNLFIYAQMLMLVLGAFFARRQENIYIEQGDAHFKEDLKQLVKNKQYLLLVFIMAMAYGTIQVAQNYLALSIVELGGSVEIVGYAIIFLVFPEVIFCGLVLKMAKKVSHLWLMLFAAGFLLVRWIVLLNTASLALLLIVSSAHGFIMAFLILVGVDMIKRIIKPNLLSTALAIYVGSASFFMGLISYFAGILLDKGINNTYFLYFTTTLSIIIAIIIYMFKYPRRVKYE